VKRAAYAIWIYFERFHKSGRRRWWNTDGDVDGMERYFWGMSNGIVMELGALDGLVLSMSRTLLDPGWHRILIEGASIWRKVSSQQLMRSLRNSYLQRTTASSLLESLCYWRYRPLCLMRFETCCCGRLCIPALPSNTHCQA
jgi:hypothetical protein